jgi:phenylalanyl-tRNA synthetase beta chain
LHPGKQAQVAVDSLILGSFGEVHPDLASRFDLKIAPLVFELDWESLVGWARKGLAYQSFTRLPLVERDLALLLDDQVSAGDLIRFLREADETVREAVVFDLYKGGQVPQGKKSLAFSLRLGRDDRTLTDEEVNVVHEKLVSGLKSKFGAQIR